MAEFLETGQKPESLLAMMSGLSQVSSSSSTAPCGHKPSLQYCAITQYTIRKAFTYCMNHIYAAYWPNSFFSHTVLAGDQLMTTCPNELQLPT